MSDAEQLRGVIAVLIEHSILDRCSSISVAGVSITLDAHRPGAAPVDTTEEATLVREHAAADERQKERARVARELVFGGALG